MKQARVRCPECKTEHDPEKVEFVDIESDIQERDVMTFVCPDCGKTVKSWVFQ